MVRCRMWPEPEGIGVAEIAKSMYRGHHPVDVPLYSFTDFARYLQLPSYDTAPPSRMRNPEFFPLGSIVPKPVPGLPRGFTGSPLDPVFSFRQLVETFLMSAQSRGWFWGYGDWTVRGYRCPHP